MGGENGSTRKKHSCGLMESQSVGTIVGGTLKTVSSSFYVASGETEARKHQ